MNKIIVCDSPKVWHLYFDRFGEVKHSVKWYREVLLDVHQIIVDLFGKDFVDNDIEVVFSRTSEDWSFGKYSSRRRDEMGFSGGGKYVVCATSCPVKVSRIAKAVDVTMRELIDELSREKNEAET